MTKQLTTLQSHNNASTRYSILRRRTAVTKVTSTILKDKKIRRERRKQNKHGTRTLYDNNRIEI